MRLSDLPNVEFFNTDKEHVQQKVFDIYTTITGRTLGEGDPVTLFLNVVLIILSLFNAKLAMILYLIVPVISFLFPVKRNKIM